MIVPTLPPQVDGIGDYTTALYKQLRLLSVPGQAEPISWSFLVNPARGSRLPWLLDEEILELPASKESLAAMLESLSLDGVLLQYGGYGYSSSGSPAWLIDGLRLWLGAHPRRAFFVMFHELWATAYPWKKVFWQTASQRNCVRELLTMASAAVTSNEYYLQNLQKLDTNKNITLIPIGSNLNKTRESSKNWRNLLIFGRGREHSLMVHRNFLRRADREGLLDCIVLAGKSTEESASGDLRELRSLGVKTQIETAYNFSPDDVPANFMECGLALMHISSSMLLKSGRFHAAALFGQVPICIRQGSAGMGFMADSHYLDYSPNNCSPLLAKLNDKDLLSRISINCMQHHKQCCSWESIAEGWSNLLLRTFSRLGITS